MNIKLTFLAACLVAASCGKPMSTAEKIAMLENQQREITADLYRQQAECNAHAIEFAADPNRQAVVTACAEALRTMMIAAQPVLANLNDRINALRVESAGKP